MKSIVDSWKNCLETNSLIKISRNKGKVKSLIDTANGKIKYLEGRKIEESNINYIFEGYYS